MSILDVWAEVFVTSVSYCVDVQVNRDPEGSGWMIKVQLSKPEEAGNLMAEGEYASYCENSSG